MVWVLVGIAFIIFSVLCPAFATIDSIIFTIQEAGLVGLVALGLGLCLLAGSFDVSLGRIAGLSVIIASWLCVNTSLSWFLILLVPLVMGLAPGILNGVLVGKGGQNPFLITLAGFFIWESLARFILYPKRYFVTRGFPPEVLFLGKAQIMGGVFASSVVFIGLVLLIWFFMKYTRKGVEIYAVGASAETARRLGINTNNTKLLVHAVAGLLAGLCGVAYIGYAVQISPEVIHPWMIFDAFVVVAIAGISITGGRGNLFHILGGAILMKMITRGVGMMGVPFWVTYYDVPGILFLVAIVLIHRLDVFRDRILSRT